jgi:hypothetical protein
MVIHLYAQCWNDAWMLPFFFRHYDALVDRYFIHDDGSSDGTWELLQSHPRVEARRFPRSDAQSFVLSEQAFSDACWKESRGQAEWVIVTDIDEHLYHRNWHGYLSGCRKQGVTLVPALGFQMISETLPQPGQVLAKELVMGAPWVKMMKPSIFNPDAITNIRFRTGRHSAEPQGNVRVPPCDEVMLFHYKYLSFAETLHRHGQLRQGLGEADIANGWGHKYSWGEAELRADWDRLAASAIDTSLVRDDPQYRYPIAPWWQRFRQ